MILFIFNKKLISLKVKLIGLQRETFNEIPVVKGKDFPVTAGTEK